jgi:hypothetical protein
MGCSAIGRRRRYDFQRKTKKDLDLGTQTTAFSEMSANQLTITEQIYLLSAMKT